MKRTGIFGGVAAILMLVAAGCRDIEKDHTEKNGIPKNGEILLEQTTVAELGLTPDVIDIRIRGLKRSYVFLWFSDLHVIDHDLSEVEEKSMSTVINRKDEMFRNRFNGLTALEEWRKLPSWLNVSGADAVFFGGDLCDFGSVANVQQLKDGLSKLTIPYMYLRADHDVRPWWLAEKNSDRVNQLEKAIDGNEDLLVMEFDDLLIIGFNNSTSNMTEKALARYQQVTVSGKPVILLTHVPIDAPGLAKPGSRNLSWGKECTYKPNAQTADFLALISSPESPVKAIFAGHIHTRWDGTLPNNVPEHTFGPAALGSVGIIRVMPE